MRKFLYYCLITATWLLVIVYLASCFTPVISPQAYSIMAVLALGFPYLAACLFIAIVVWFFIKKKYSLFLSIILASGFVNLHRTLAINLPATATNNSNNIRLLSWNVENFGRPDKWLDTAGNARRRMLLYIKRANADIVCLQEMAEYEGEGYNSNAQALRQLGYRYAYIPMDKVDKQPSAASYSGSGIYSRYPIIATGATFLGDSSFPENLMYADVIVKNDTIRIATCHFKSINIFNKRNLQSPTPFHGDTTLIYKRSPLEKLAIFGSEHAHEATIVKTELAKSPHPLIFTADMNSVPTSHAYDIIADGMQDAFIKKGNGLGGSLDSLPKTLRIDFMFADRSFRIRNYHQDRIALSDHFPHYMDIELKR